LSWVDEARYVLSNFGRAQILERRSLVKVQIDFFVRNLCFPIFHRISSGTISCRFVITPGHYG